jgi:hypothetical protein
MRGLPPYSTHLALLEHDRLHGQGLVRWGPRIHWLRTWLVQRTREWSSHQVIVCGSNPLLGALACAGLVRCGARPLWLCSNALDAWDYPLAMAGAHDDLFAKVGLPPMGPDLFKKLGSICEGKAKVGWGWGIDYEFSSQGKPRLCFARAEHLTGSDLGAARLAAQTMAARAFENVAVFKAGISPHRHGGKARVQVVQCARCVWTSDQKDGLVRIEPGSTAPEKAQKAQFEQNVLEDIRLGRSRWHTQTPLAFAEQSREDIKRVLELGRWP